jgi:DNA-binding transcriptional LysR family regulator
MNATYYGHACFSVEIGEKHLLFDPYISQNPLAKSVDIKQIPADYILISHGHDDHIGDTIKIAKRTEHDGVSSIIAAVEVGRGFALVPSCVVSMAGPRLKLLSLKPALPAVPVVAIWRKESETKIVKYFVASARQDS